MAQELPQSTQRHYTDGKQKDVLILLCTPKRGYAHDSMSEPSLSDPRPMADSVKRTVGLATLSRKKGKYVITGLLVKPVNCNF